MKQKFERLTTTQLKKKLRANQLHGIALDIDDTLSYTDEHWIEQMRLKFGNPENLTKEEIIKKYKWIEAVPYWQSQGAAKVLKKLMHSNDFQESIPLIENANHVVQKINRLVPVVAYVTARPTTVFAGTKNWLQKHGFPPAPIVFRPLRIAHANKILWKAKTLRTLYPEVEGIIDDSPHLIQELKSVKYRGVLYLYDSGRNIDSKKNLKQSYDQYILRCRSWGDVYKLISNSLK